MKKVKLIAVIAALIAGIGMYFFLKEISKPKVAPHTDAVVALVDIPENTLITEDMVEVRPIIDEALQPNHLYELDSVVGFVSSDAIYAGEQIVKNRLVRMGEVKEDNNSLAYILEEGMRAVTLAVNTTTGMENLIKPGNKVDVILNYTYPKEPETTENDKTAQEDGTAAVQEEERATRLIAQNKKVLASGTGLTKDGAEEYTTVTLETTPDEAVLISYAEFTGSIKLILRSTLDGEIVEPIEVDLAVLRGEEENK